jgi:hypothetical protein
MILTLKENSFLCNVPYIYNLFRTHKFKFVHAIPIFASSSYVLYINLLKFKKYNSPKLYRNCVIHFCWSGRRRAHKIRNNLNFLQKSSEKKKIVQSKLNNFSKFLSPEMKFGRIFIYSTKFLSVVPCCIK